MLRIDVRPRGQRPRDARRGPHEPGWGARASSRSQRARPKAGKMPALPVRAPRRLLWPVHLVYRIWTSAVADEAAIRHNLRLLAVLTAIFSLPDLIQGLLFILHSAASGGRLYGAYVLTLGALELAGSALLAYRSTGGRLLIVCAAAGFYLEAVLGLAGLERSVISAAIFAACAPAEAWVIWFLCHERVRAHLYTRTGTGWLKGESLER